MPFDVPFSNVVEESGFVKVGKDEENNICAKHCMSVARFFIPVLAFQMAHLPKHCNAFILAE